MLLEASTLVNIAVILCILLVSLGLHEAVHAFVAYNLGDDTAEQEGRLTLNPLRHIDPLTTIILPLILLLSGLPPILAAKPVPFNPYKVRFGEYGAALVGVSGPLTNLALAVLGALFINANLFSGLAEQVALLFVWMNIGIFVFNMIPIPPLDGSRLLYAFAPEPVQRVMSQLEHYGIFVIFALFIAMASIIGPVLLKIDQSILQFLIR